jgi:DNA-binding MarR family transcriptional regulator
VPTSRDLPVDRLAVGQLLVRLLAEFRRDLLSAAMTGGYPDLRESHLHIFGNVGVEGIRLTGLAANAQLSLATTSELVDELQRLGYLERRPDPSDRRAKLIFPTTKGRSALNDAGHRVAEIEENWALLIGRRRFEATCQSMQSLLNDIERAHSQGRLSP